MEIIKTQAIVLRSMKFGNTSKIVTFFTRDCGKIKVMAKGSRRLKSKFGGSLEQAVLTEIIFYFKEGRDLQIITDSDIHEPFLFLRNDIKKTIYASAACEMVDKLVEEKSVEVFHSLYWFLQLLNSSNSKNLETFFWAFQLKLFSILGYRPDFEYCMQCSGELVQSRDGVYCAQGGLVCSICSNNAVAQKISIGSLKILQKLLKVPLQKVDTYKVIRSMRSECRYFADYFMRYHGNMEYGIRSLRSLGSLIST